MVRLELELDAPRVVAGDTASCELTIDSDRETPARVVMTAVARSGYRLGLISAAHATGGSQIDERTLASHSTTVELVAGRATVPWSFAVPSDLPPTHDAFGVGFAQVSIDVTVEAATGSNDRSFALEVDAAVREPTPRPATAASPTAVHKLELAVATARLGPGDTLAGTCAAVGMKDHRPRRVTITLAGTLTLEHESLRLSDGERHPVVVVRSVVEQELVLPSGIADAAVPFAFVIPPIAPSLAIATHRVEWALVGTTDQYFFEGPARVELPLEIVAPGAIAKTTAPPPIGAPEAVELCARVAEPRGLAIDPSIVVDAALGTIHPRVAIDDEPIRIWTGIAHKDGAIAIVTGVHYRSLELGLEVVRSSAIRELLAPRDPESGIDDWDRKHRVHARDAEGVTAVLRAIVPLLARVGAVVRWTDVELVTEQPIVGGVEPSAFADVIDGARAIGRALEALATHTAGPYR